MVKYTWLLFIAILVSVLFVTGCADEDIYTIGIHNISGGNYFDGNCSGGITYINSSGGISCRDVSTWYLHIEGNETSMPGTGDMVQLLNDTNSGNSTFYYIVGDDFA